MRKRLTLAFIEHDGQLLLGLKKRGFGVGKWNGFGGKVAVDETVDQANRREFFEECGVSLDEAERVGVCEFEFSGNPEIMEVHVFRALRWHGEPVESDEMRPRWFSRVDLPFGEMWPDDRHWLPVFLSGSSFTAYFLYDERGQDILGFSVSETAELPPVMGVRQMISAQSISASTRSCG